MEAAPPPSTPPGVLLAIDFGRARLGVAICDPLGITVRPLGHIDRQTDRQAATLVARLAAQEQARALVIGLPLHAHGDAGEAVQWVRIFIAALRPLTPLPIHEVDERYSSEEAASQLQEVGRWPARPGEVDARAAAIILRRFLDGER